jgi:hypothetical protein
LHQESYRCAIDSLIKALWIQTRSTNSCPHHQIALNLHRLGVAYELSKDYSEASAVFESAIQFYDKAAVPGDHKFYLSAQESLSRVKQRQDKLLRRMIRKKQLSVDDVTESTVKTACSWVDNHFHESVADGPY